MQDCGIKIVNLRATSGLHHLAQEMEFREFFDSNNGIWQIDTAMDHIGNYPNTVFWQFRPGFYQ